MQTDVKQPLPGDIITQKVKRCKITNVEKVLDDCGIALHSLSSLKKETLARYVSIPASGMMALANLTLTRAQDTRLTDL